MTKTSDYQRHRANGFTAGAIALLFLFSGVVLIFTDLLGIAILLFVIAIFVWNASINHFEKAAPLEPTPSDVEQLLHYSAKLKNGAEVAIAIELKYLNDTGRSWLSTLEARITRTLDEYFVEQEVMPQKPSAAVDRLLSEAITPEAERLGLTNFSIYTIKVQTTSAPPKSRGIVLGER